MNGGVYATNTINDAFALVSTQGYADIPVSYENQPIGKTDAHGYLLVPTVTSTTMRNSRLIRSTCPPTSRCRRWKTRRHSRSQRFLVEFPINPSPPPTSNWLTSKANRWPTAARWRWLAAISKLCRLGWHDPIDPVQQHNRLSVIPGRRRPAVSGGIQQAKPQGIQRVGPVVCR
ncbi:hypothetical protein M8494_13405 [Serratia ureilytica]